MKALSWILGFIALSATIFLAVNWSISRKHMKQADAESVTYAEKAQAIQIKNQLERDRSRQWLRTDRLKVEAADAEIDIARLEGRSAKDAITRFAKAQSMVAADEQAIEADEMLERFGGDPDVRDLVSRVKACAESHDVYQSKIKRDENLAYAVGVVWLAFGFAVALAARSVRGNPF